MGRAFFTKEPLRRLGAENLITEVDGDDSGPDRLGGGILEENTGGARDHCRANTPIGIGGQDERLGAWALRGEQSHKVDARRLV